MDTRRRVCLLVLREFVLDENVEHACFATGTIAKNEHLARFSIRLAASRCKAAELHTRLWSGVQEVQVKWRRLQVLLCWSALEARSTRCDLTQAQSRRNRADRVHTAPTSDLRPFFGSRERAYHRPYSSHVTSFT